MLKDTTFVEKICLPSPIVLKYRLIKRRNELWDTLQYRTQRSAIHSPHLLHSRNLFRKTKFGTCTVTRLHSFKIDLLGLHVCFPNSDHVMFSREFFFCLFINYVYIYTWMHVNKTTFERNSFLGYNHMVLNVNTKHTS